MTSSVPSSFLLADDHNLVRKAFIRLLSSDFPNATFHQANNGQEALKILSQYPLDVLFLDVSMPEFDGYQLHSIVKKQYPKLKTILITSHDTEEVILHFIKDGIDGICLKGEDIELSEVIRTVWRGDRWFSKIVYDKMLRSLQHLNSVSLPLSEQKRKLIRHIADGKSSREIAEIMNLGEKTVNSYRQNLLRITQTRNTDELVAFAFCNGLMGK